METGASCYSLMLQMGCFTVAMLASLHTSTWDSKWGLGCTGLISFIDPLHAHPLHAHHVGGQ